MDMERWLSAWLQLLVLFLVAASCYLPAKNQMRYTPLKTAGICFALLFPCSLLGAWLHGTLQVGANTVFLSCLVLFFFLYRYTLKTDLPRALAIFVGVCAVQTFPLQFACAFDAWLHPMSGAGQLSQEAALLQLILACLMPVAAAKPSLRYSAWAVDNLDIPKVWHSAVALSAVFLIFNVLALPDSYSTLYTGRMYTLFLVFESGALSVLILIYLLFYRGARLITEHSRLKERTQLLEMQVHQYRTLQDYMQQTKRMRHDFRHHLRLLSTLAGKGDLEGIQTHLAEYEIQLTESTPVNYCKNSSLNALFAYYREMAAQEGIRTDFHISLPEPLTVSELDLASLFGNLMENAIAGCRTLPEAERYFCLTAEVRHNNSLYVVSTNSFDGTVRKGRDGYRSTKHGGKGTGLASIAAIAEKYRGSADFSNSDRDFFADVAMKI